MSAQALSTTATARATLRAGVIGLGVGERHLEAFGRHPACEAVVACDIAADRRRAVAARHPGLKVVADPGTVLGDPRIDLVSIASYDDAHAGQVLEALDRGKHVFVEKPLCRTAEEARRIRRALDARPDLKLSSNLVLRTSPRFRRVRRMIAGGDFGDLFHLEGEYNYGRLHKLTDGWRGRQRDYSVVLGGAVHLVDLLLWLTGRRVTDVAAFGNGIASRPRFNGDDMVAALLRFEDGVTATVTANFGCVRPHGHGLVVCGTEATFVNDHPHGRLYASRDAQTAPRPVTEPHPGRAKGRLIARFVDHVLGSGPPGVTAGEVFAAMAVCFAIDEARRDGRVVPVEPPS